MPRKSLTTAALLAAALALPAAADDAPAHEVHVEHDVVVVQNADGGEREVVVVRAVGEEPDGNHAHAVRARAIMLDQDGNVIELDGDAAPRINRADNIHIEMLEMGVPGVEFIEGDDGDVRVFLRQLGQPDVVPAAPVNPPMVEATYLGLNCEPLDFDTAALLLVAEGTGLDVTFVAPDSPAAAAGLEVGDTLLKMGDQVLINPEQLAVLIRTHDEGDAVTLHVLRGGEEFDLTAELGTNTVPQLGPGGRNLSQFWNVERQGNAGQPGQFRVLPEGLHGDIALIAPQAEEFAAQMALIESVIADRVEAMRDVAEAHRHADQMREQMRVHEEAIRQLIEQIHGGQRHFDAPQEFQFEDNAAMQIVWNDGEHTIEISGDGEGNQTLNVKDAEGNELYDGPMPEGDAIDELPEGVGEKVREITEGQHFEFNIEVAPGAEPAPEAPAAPAAPGADL